MPNREQRRAARKSGLVLPNGAPHLAKTPTVGYGFCHAGNVGYPLGDRSLRHVLIYDLTRPVRENSAPWIVNEYQCEASGVHVPDVRCDIVRMFLADELQPEWLWVHDDDATFPPTHLDQLMSAADVDERPIVGCLAFGVAPDKDENGVDKFNEVQATELKLFPTLYYFDDDGTTGMWFDYPRDAVIPVHSTGCHSFVVHRRVLEDPRWLEPAHPNPWFRTVPNKLGTMMSEDQFFFVRAGSLGYPTHVNTGARTGHVKTFIADEDLFLRQQPDRAASESADVLTSTPPVDGLQEGAAEASPIAETAS